MEFFVCRLLLTASGLLLLLLRCVTSQPATTASPGTIQTEAPTTTLVPGIVTEIPEVPTLCAPEAAANVLWIPASLNPTMSVIPCGKIHGKLRGGRARRTCVEGSWSAIDFSECSVSVGSNPFLLLWLPFTAQKELVMTSMEMILTELVSLLALSDDSGLQPTLLGTVNSPIPPQYTSALVVLSFPPGIPSADTVQTLQANLPTLLEPPSLGGLGLRTTGLGYKGFLVANSCSCVDAGSDLFRSSCAGNIPLPPCTCNPENCQCTGPVYVGDGASCTPDVDTDSYPAAALPSCEPSSQATYCQLDNCPFLYNPDQDMRACQAPPNFNGCPLQQGVRLDIVWANTLRGEMDVQRCPDARGFATRLCHSDGMWSPMEDVTMCMSYDFDSAFTTAADIFARGGAVPLRDRLQSASDVTDDILSLTGRASAFSLLPTDLNSTNRVLGGVIDLLEESLDSTENTTDLSDTNVLDIFSNVLEGQNVDGWQELTSIGDGTPKLLDNMERYALYQSRNVMSADGDRRLWQRSNIAIGFQRVSGDTTAALKFPESVEDLQEGLGLDFIPAQVELPPTAFRARRGPNRSIKVPSSSFLVRNMEQAMPTDTENEMEDVGIASMIISAQVDERGMAISELSTDPVKLMFQFDPVENATRYLCAYWKFSDPIGNGFWAFDGINMTSIEVRGDRMEVNCSATHLTSFAILVDVSGVQSGISDAEAQALQIVSYIGCGISIFFLLITIIFFLSQGRDLCIKVHYFIHLNLAISLCLAYTLFAVAGETAARVEELCIAVTTILHYLFLSSFCWMLCEGIMLYLLLVVVFSRLSKNIWFFLLIGYVLPIVPVAISVGVRHDSYGVRDQDGNLTFCWLSTEDGIIWAFTGPMLAIILVNLIFLIMALVTVFRSKRSKHQRSTAHRRYKKKESSISMKDTENKSSFDFTLFKTLFLAVLVLLPMLGLTWVLGLFAVNRNTTVFAWIFAVVNSLQGLFIFLFHVVKSDKVWKNPRAIKLRSTVSYTFKSSSKSSSSVGDSYDLGNSTTSTRPLNHSSTSKSMLTAADTSEAVQPEEEMQSQA